MIIQKNAHQKKNQVDTEQQNTGMNRRTFLKSTAVAGASLSIGFAASGILTTATAASEPAGFNPYVRINADGTATIICKHFEMGQGTSTGLTTLVAEELDIAWDDISMEFAPSNNELYKNLAFGSQGTGGSTAIANSFIQYRTAGAADWC